MMEIRNPVLRDYIRQYQEIYSSFTEQVEQFGLLFAPDREEELRALRSELRTLGISERNEGASLVHGEVCGACAACRTGIDSYTGILSLMCHRSCFFCFNPNQTEFEDYSGATKDWQTELKNQHRRNPKMKYIALTGGEPLLHREDCVAYFRMARSLWPEASLRLYTSGDLLDADLLDALRGEGLEEIRFSIKLDDIPERSEKVWRNLAMAREYIPRVMVEMPVMPDAEEEMKGILARLEELGIYGINLLELCFPYHNAEEFRKRGYALRWPPYRTLYNFWYAGGLPVDGSEAVALKLLREAVQKQYRLSVHYCSLENKHFGQVYQQNLNAMPEDGTFVMSEKDFYLKTIKVFGRDMKEAERLFRARQRTDFSTGRDFLRCSPACAMLLKKKDMELGISYNIREFRDGESVIRELRIDPIRASEFDEAML
ncbi:MAG: radical SAM protein [Oscillospiraceae bacterium]|nr:radical SAM protein [Oscillospiraceae bacterium]